MNFQISGCRILSVIMLSLGAMCASAQAHSQIPGPSQESASGPASLAPARVMLIGLWHFDNPGLDAVKYTPIDVMKPAEQAYLRALSARIASFKPTRVLLEYQPKDDPVFNQRYAGYLEGKFELRLNEIYQLGFRIAKLSGLKSVSGFDVRDVPGDNAIWGHLMKDPALSKEFTTMIAGMSAKLNEQHKTMSLKALLQRNNHPEEDHDNKSFYLWLNPIGTADAPYMGADAATQWWQRNFRMYALIQKAAKPGERVVVIAGQGHTAILRDLLKSDRQRVEEKPDSYF